MPLQRSNEQLLHRQTAAREITRVLGLRIHPDGLRRRTTQLPREGLALLLHSVNQGQDLLQSGDLELAIETDVAGTDLGNALADPQSLQLLQSEVFGEPSGHPHT